MAAAPPVEAHISKSGLTSLQRGLILTVVVAQFLFLHGLVWHKLNDLDASILWSYATIPAWVALALVASRRLTVRHFFLATLEIALAKFVITATILVVVLIAGGSPSDPEGRSVDHPIAAPSASAAPVARPAAPPSVIPPEQRGTLSGTVTDAAGQPVADAVVYVSSGLEAYTFAPRTDTLSFTNAGRGFEPRVAAIQVGQPLSLRALDQHLHTMAGETDATQQVFNLPVLASGAPTVEHFTEAYGLVSVWCTVAGAAGVESPARLAVLAHPFFTRTDASGHYTLADVPAGDLEITAIAGASARSGKNVSLHGGARNDVQIALP